jgi:hypothetical protein
MPRPATPGCKPRVSADRIKRSNGPPVHDPKEIEPTQRAEPKSASRKKAAPIRGPPIPRAAYSISEFCGAFGISPRMYFKMRRESYGPREMRVGRRVLIPVEAALAWARAREVAGHVSPT